MIAARNLRLFVFGAILFAMGCGAGLFAAERSASLSHSQIARRQGTLFIVGGGHPPESVYNEFVRLAGGPSARLVLIPSGNIYKTPADVEHRYGGWHQMHVASFQFLNASSRDEANSDSFISPLTKATGVWIAGGRQTRLASLYDGTKVEQALRQIFDQGGVIGGTSAGASIMSRMMISYGSSTEAVMGRGFGLLDGVVVDQHFTQRGRYPRLLGVVEQYPDVIGLGIDEGTAAVVQGEQLQVLGASQVTVCVPTSGQRATTVYRLKASQKMNLGSVRKSTVLGGTKK